jgi:hypothetical protein
MTIQELSRYADTVEMQGLSMMVLAVPRTKAPPKRIDRVLPCSYIGGTRTDYIVSVDIANVRKYVLRNCAKLNRHIRVRVQAAAEKISKDLREKAGMADPPSDPWASTPVED